MEVAKSNIVLQHRKEPFFQRLIKNFNRYKFIYLLMLPGILYFAVFHYYPLYFLQVAFKKYNVFKGLSGSPWVGLDNFKLVLTSKYFIEAFQNTVILSLMKKVFQFPVPILLALLLNELKNKYFARSVQTLIYLPHFLSWVIVGGMISTVLSPSGGIVNEILGIFGKEPVFFMAEKKLFRWVLLFSAMWKECGWGTIVYLAAIIGIDQEMYEAAKIDGANRLKQTFYITIPSILPTIIVMFILSLGSILNIFEQVFVMYNPAVAAVSETIDTYVYQIGMQKGDIAFASAVGLFKNIISLTLILLTNKMAKKYQGYSII